MNWLPFSTSPARGLRSLLLAAALGSLAGSGCLRFGYVDRRGSTPSDAGMDAGPAANGGDAGRSDAGQDTGTAHEAGSGGASSAGSGGSVAVAGSGGRASAGSGGTGGRAVDAGTIDAMDSGMVTDSGVADAAAADGGKVYEKCLERAGAVFCDGFETADPDFEHWDYDLPVNGTVARSMTRAHSGSWSLRAATTQGTATSARMATLALAEQKSGDVWLRFFNWVPASVQIQKNFSIGIISEAEQPYAGFELRILPGNVVDLNTSSSLGVVAGDSSVKYTRDKWVCVELHMFIDVSSGYYEAYLDDALAVRTSFTDTTAADGYSAAEVGVHYAPPEQGPTELFVDDVVVAHSRIGCD